MTTDTVGGVWTYCMDLCHALQAHGIEVHLVTMGDNIKPWQQAAVNQLSNVTVHQTNYKLEWMQEPWADIKACGEWLLQLEASIQPNLIHLNCYAYGAWPFKAPVMVAAHSDVYSWFLEVKQERPPATWQAYFDCVQKGLSNADIVIAPSRTMMGYIKTIYKVKGPRQVIYNGRNKVPFYEAVKEPVVFAMGRIWDEAKNIQLLIAAAPIINAPVHVAGDSSFDGNNIAIQQTNLKNLGKLSTQEVAAALATAAVYVLPAKYEPFGLSAVEAGLSGCALVLSDIPSLREIWGDAALYVDTADEKALAQTVNGLLEDKVLLKAYSARAKAQAQKYAAERMALQYVEAYHQLLGKEKQTFLKELV